MSNDTPTSLRTPWTTSLEDSARLERKLMEQRFESEQLRLLGSAIYVSGQGIAILTPAVEAVGPRVAFVNDGFCALYGRNRAEIIGQTPEVFGIVARHGAMYDALLRHVFETNAVDAETTPPPKDGHEFEADLQPL